MTKGDIKQGDIIFTDFDPSVGHEYQQHRPAIVIQGNTRLKTSNLVTVIPLTSKTGKVMQEDIIICKNSTNKLWMNSVIKVYCISSFDYARFKKKIGKIESNEMVKIKESLRKHFDL